VRGNALCSIYGGTTANSEFEFLTSLSMAYLPSNSVPYQQFVHEDMFSLAWVMEKYGYRCFATHPYLADGWSRPTIYPMLGLKESTFLEDYPQKDMVRCFVSDREMFGYVLDKVSSNQTDQPWFIFGITMQNHSSFSYTGENYTQTIELEGYSREYPLAEQYLSLLHESDSALEMFLTELEEHPENTIVLFFGDHFPRVEATFLEELHGGSFGTLDEQMLQYTVPFFIWANFDIPEQTVEYTSLNYLALYLLETAGLPLPEYYQFIADLRDVVPAMNAFGYYSLSAQSFISFEEATGEEREWLDKYAVLQYNSLVDTKNRSDLFFEHYCGE
jgi:phosphoglycerol transferase MdoB-like AlkP superfamily enzyme